MTSGIGRETAIALSADGWKVVLSGRRVDALNETARLCIGHKPLIVPGDITDEHYVGTLFNAVKTEHGRLDLLFNVSAASEYL